MAKNITDSEMTMEQIETTETISADEIGTVSVDALAESKEKKEKVVNRVTMEDGTVIDFGARNQITSAVAMENRTITFNVIDGKIHTFNFKDLLDGLEDFYVSACLSAFRDKMKQIVAKLKQEDILEGLNKVYANLLAKEFSIRTEEKGIPELSYEQKAYAKYVVSKGKHEEWADLTDTNTIEAVMAEWQSLTVKQRNLIKKHPQIKILIGQMQLEDGTFDSEDELFG